MQICCQTDFAVVLVGARFERGLWKFLDIGNADTPGYLISVEPLKPIFDQLIGAVRATEPALISTAIHVDQSFAELFSTVTRRDATLYIAQIASDFDSAKLTRTWRTMPEILRRMAKTRARLAFLKSWQIFSGAAKEEISAIEFGELEKIIKSKSTRDSNPD